MADRSRGTAPIQVAKQVEPLVRPTPPIIKCLTCEHTTCAGAGKHDEWACKSYTTSKTPAPAATSGIKHDTGKPRFELIPPEALDGLAAVLTFGATKYSDRNWEKGMKWSRVFGALMRHMWAWWRGEKRDVETGLSHLHHAACCIAFLQTYETRGSGEDDRTNSSVP